LFSSISLWHFSKLSLTLLCVLQKVPVLAQRAFSISARQLKNKVPDAQKIFQEDNGLPVHIKGGVGDVLMYRATMALTIGGTFYSIYWLVYCAFPHSKA
ncbi:cytochrome c oxidase subunit 7A2, mitochondrial-like, partial [Trematomus bernacchii]|uniref:cytochrome c oxidase subunit 7A2, mitochondrial-like n=1 Tax=Trematomus bernacchii TaxID=40690 RepID=UPI00146C4C82